jgi:orotate phosphoribosyltransferase
MTSDLDELRRIVSELGHEERAEKFALASGELSEHFIDGKRALAHGRHLALACRVMLQATAQMNIEFDAVGGLTLGADHFSHGIAMLGEKDWFVVRKEPKGRGTNRLIEGTPIGPGSRVLLVDDVVTTGGSILRAYDAIVGEGAAVVGAITLVDRSGVARRSFEDRGVPYRALVTYGDLGIPPVGRGYVHA